MSDDRGVPVNATHLKLIQNEMVKYPQLSPADRLAQAQRVLAGPTVAEMVRRVEEVENAGAELVSSSH